MKEGVFMAEKKQEIKVVWAHNSAGLIEGRFFFVNPFINKTGILTMAGGPDEKVLKAKARIKATAPERIADYLANHPGFVQVDQETYDKAYDKAHGIVRK
jgi:hypothetical protein